MGSDHQVRQREGGRGDLRDDVVVARRCVSLSEIKVLKQPEAMPGTGGMGKLLQGLGLAPPPPPSAAKPPPRTEQSAAAAAAAAAAGGPTGYPSPLEFARKAYSDEKDK